MKSIHEFHTTDDLRAGQAISSRACAGLLAVVVAMFAAFPAAGNAAPIPVPDPPRAEARAYLLEDINSGRILAESNADSKIEPASLTKLLTAYIVFSELETQTVNLDDKVLVSTKAWHMPGSRMFIEPDTRVSVEDLIKGMIVQSGNDATVALAEHIAGSEDAFASLMNHYAETLGMKHSHFVNSTGLPNPEHYTTARDLSILTQAIIRDFPEYYEWYSVREFTYNNITQHNRNKLLWSGNNVDGVKTGHTESAGFCLVASAKEDEMRLISVVIGAKSEDARAQESMKLLNYGFRFFETHRLYQANTPLTSAKIWKGAADQIPLGVDADVYVTIPRNQYKDLKATMDIATEIVAPVSQGQNLGKVQVKLGDETVIERPLVALNAVAEGDLAQRVTDEIMMFFQ